MKMHDVTSSQIDSLGWESGELRIKFKRGATYSYANVSEPQFKKLLNAKSVGAEFASTIKHNPVKFPFHKLGENGATNQSTETLIVANPLAFKGDWSISIEKDAEKQAKSLVLQSSKIKTVDSDSSAEVARTVLKDLANFRIALEKARKREKQRFLDGGNYVDSLAHQLGDPVSGEEERIGGKEGLISEFAKAQEAKRRESEEKARALQEEAERKEREGEEARIAAEQAEMQRFQEMEDGKKRAAEKLRLEALEQQRKAEAAERAEELARKAAFQASIAAMAAPTKGTKVVLDYQIESIERLYQAMPSLVTLTIKRRETLEFLQLQQQRGLPVGLPGLKVIEEVKVSPRG